MGTGGGFSQLETTLSRSINMYPLQKLHLKWDQNSPVVIVPVKISLKLEQALHLRYRPIFIKDIKFACLKIIAPLIPRYGG